MAVSNVNSSSSSTNGTSFGANSTLNDVNIDDFLKLMIAELQNQDPLNPLDNDELVQQFSQIRQVGATDKLTSTLDSVLLGQNIASATNLIGAEIDGISDDGQDVTGMVERVSVANNQPKLHLALRPRATASTKEGEMEAGDYEYRVVWQQNGTQFGLDPLASGDGTSRAIRIQGREGVDQAVQLSNLPATDSTRKVYRRAVGESQFKLVGTITDNKAATFLDTKSKSAASTVLTGSVQPITSQREFEVSLKNVGQIRPPTVTTPVTPVDPDDDAQFDEEDHRDYQPDSRPEMTASET